MLYKPTNPTPYNSVIDPSNGVSFKASCVNTSEISKLRLMIDNNSYKYYFNGIGSYKDGEISIDIAADKLYSGYSISNSNYDRNDFPSRNICGNSNPILKSPKNYNWQVRLYQNDCNVNIAYGFIQDVYTSPASKYNASASCILKVRPHTNMFFETSSNSGFNIKNSKSEIPKNLLNYYDTNVEYQIMINGEVYNVLAYYYSSKQFSLEADSYNDPLFAYIEINSNGNEINKDDEYSIYTNYIDSNEFYFRCRKGATLTLTDQFNKDITDKFKDGTDADRDKNNISITYSNFILNGTYNQYNNASVNYYRVTLYQISDDDSETLLYDTGNIYQTQIIYSYDDFFAGKLYKLILQITDTDRKSIIKSIYITPDYKITVEPRTLNVIPYRDHKSIILDFNDLISISGHEKVEGGHSFDEIGISTDDNDNWEIVDSVGDTTKNIGTCYVQLGNTITYDTIDGSNTPLKCSTPLLSMVFKCNDRDTQQIFELVDDNNIKYKLFWDKHLFYYYIYSPATTNISGYDIFATYSPYQDAGFPNRALGGVFGTDDFPAMITAINEELAKDSPSYNVPYIAFQDIKTDENEVYSIRIDDNYYTHTESVVRDFWWHVIIKEHYFYIKCLNPPVGHSWKYEKR